MGKRRQNFQNIAWFFDLYNRKLLDLDPPFQRRSVWTPRYREDFIDTVLMDYPAPAIFLFTNISDQGATNYQVVDGKQRLKTIFDFIGKQITVGERSPIAALSGKYFDELDKDRKIAFFQYDFSVEYLPTNDESIIDSVFDRLNRNVVKLTAQELRHARFSGQFISAAEELQVVLETKFEFGSKFPRIRESSRWQMKDVEVVATLLLFLEEGVKNYSTSKLDEAFAERDEEWEQGRAIIEEFRVIANWIEALLDDNDGTWLATSRLRNQADFYSLFAAIGELERERHMPKDCSIILSRLSAFLETVEDDSTRATSKTATSYYDAARSASNDPGPRRVRINILKAVISGNESQVKGE